MCLCPQTEWLPRMHTHATLLSTRAVTGTVSYVYSGAVELSLMGELLNWQSADHGALRPPGLGLSQYFPNVPDHRPSPTSVKNVLQLGIMGKRHVRNTSKAVASFPNQHLAFFYFQCSLIVQISQGKSLPWVSPIRAVISWSAQVLTCWGGVTDGQHRDAHRMVTLAACSSSLRPNPFYQLFEPQLLRVMEAQPSQIMEKRQRCFKSSVFPFSRLGHYNV